MITQTHCGVDFFPYYTSLYPIVLHPFIYLGYPIYWDKTRTYFVWSPLRGISLPFIRFSESRILTLGHPHKHCRISLVDELGSDKSIDSASQTNIYRSFSTLRFCVNTYKIVSGQSRNLFQGFSFSKSVLASWQVLGLWVMAHLITCKPWTHPLGNWSLSQHPTSWHT